jgi:hypothetical protein
MLFHKKVRKWIRAIFDFLPQHNFFFSLLISPLEEVLFFSLFFSSSQNKIIYFFITKKNVFFWMVSALSELPFFFKKKVKSFKLVLWPKNILLNFLCTTMINGGFIISIFHTFFFTLFFASSTLKLIKHTKTFKTPVNIIRTAFQKKNQFFFK